MLQFDVQKDRWIGNVVAAISPDDKTLYLAARDPLGTSAVLEGIVAFDLQSGQQKQVIAVPGPRDPRGGIQGFSTFSLSPDGRSFAIWDPIRVARIQVDGSDYRELYTTTPPWRSPVNSIAWTKDSGAILFAERKGEALYQISRISVDGGKPEFTGLEINGLVEGNAIAVSPDGLQLAVTSFSESVSELWSLDNLSILKNRQ